MITSSILRPACMILMLGCNGLTAVAAESNGIGPERNGAVIPVSEESGRAGSGQRLSIQSTNLESLLLEKGVITQEDWIRLKAEEERRVFEQSAEL